MATYDVYLTTPVPGGYYVIPNNQDGTNESITDANSPPGDVILGTVSSDTFMNDNGQSFTYLGYATGLDSNGNTITGFIGSESSNGEVFFFTASGTVLDSNLQELTFYPSTAGVNEYDTTTGTPIPCFVAGTMIATPTGEVAVENLRAGDSVLTADGATTVIRWAGSTIVSKVFADPVATLPIRIRAGALAENVPAQDLLVSPGHAVKVDDVLVHASALVNGTSITRETDMPVVFTYYHIETSAHDLLIANGAPAESFLEATVDARMDNAAERDALPGDAPTLEMDLPRVKSARQLPAHIRAQLAARAAILNPEPAQADFRKAA